MSYQKFQEALSEFITDRGEDSYHKLLQTDLEYQKLKKQYEKQGIRLDHVLEKLTPKQRKVIDSYIELTVFLCGKEQDHAYLQGYTDCIYLLYDLALLPAFTQKQ